MENVLDKLNDYLENASPEQKEKDWFTVWCKVEGIDPNDPNAKKKLKKIQRKRKWAPVWQAVKEIVSLFLGVEFIMWSCAPLLKGNFILFALLHIIGFCFIGWRLSMEREKYN